MGDDPRTAKYRLLQSWYREEVLGARPGTYKPRGRPERPLGSLLHRDEVAQRNGLNFLDPKIHAYTAERAKAVGDENGTIDEYRLMHNMLSSMPMCFNLFGMVRETPDARLPFVTSLFDPEAIEVEMIECEWTPRLPEASISDRTAFDAAIITRRSDGSRHLIGVETKYTELFSPTRYGAPDRRRDAGRYRDVHVSSGWFDPSSHDRLTASPTNQLWRNCLLAAAAERAGEFDTANVAVVALGDDPGATKAIAGVTEAMTDPSRCHLVSLEQITSVSKKVPQLAEWSCEFERRYLDLGRVERSAGNARPS